MKIIKIEKIIIRHIFTKNQLILTFIFNMSRQQIYEALVCESNGAMFTQKLYVTNGKIKYSQIPLDLKEFMGDRCFQIPSMHELLRNEDTKRTILHTTKNKKINQDGTYILDYEDFGPNVFDK
jgi:hypothetical protein